MKMSDLLNRSRVLIPFHGRSVRAGVDALANAMEDRAAEAQGAHSEADREVAQQRVSPRTLLVWLPPAERPAAGLLVAPEPLSSDGGDTTRLMVALRPDRAGQIGEEARRRIEAVLGLPEVEAALLTAESADRVLGLPALMDLELVRATRVRDALTPMSYRIYPDTPLSEIADLMARKSLAAVPVVGEGLQVLGIITSGDALARVLESRSGRTGSTDKVQARDVMSRAVLCVTEDQDLADAAAMMAKRQLAQLPVVREGEMVGFLTREAALRALVSRGD